MDEDDNDDADDDNVDEELDWKMTQDGDLYFDEETGAWSSTDPGVGDDDDDDDDVEEVDEEEVMEKKKKKKKTKTTKSKKSKKSTQKEKRSSPSIDTGGKKYNLNDFENADILEGTLFEGMGKDEKGGEKINVQT